eukprot:4130845-Alexandrium_andersonii.AAC.1
MAVKRPSLFAPCAQPCPCLGLAITAANAGRTLAPDRLESSIRAACLTGHYLSWPVCNWRSMPSSWTC